MDREEIIWAAGLFEGEGCFCWTSTKNRNGKENRYTRCQVSIHMTDKDVMERFLRAVGRGHINGPYTYTTKDVPERKPSWYWAMAGHENFQYIAALFWPWLGERRRAKIKEVLALELSARPHGWGTRNNEKTGRFE